MWIRQQGCHRAGKGPRTTPIKHQTSLHLTMGSRNFEKPPPLLRGDSGQTWKPRGISQIPIAIPLRKSSDWATVLRWVEVKTQLKAADLHQNLNNGHLGELEFWATFPPSCGWFYPHDAVHFQQAVYTTGHWSWATGFGGWLCSSLAGTNRRLFLTQFSVKAKLTVPSSKSYND